MKKTTKIFLFLLTVIFNILFFSLCGYWQQMQLNLFYLPDLLFGLAAIIVLGMGEVSVILQLLFRKKFSQLKKRVFGRRLPLQCVLLILYYASSLLFSNALIYRNMVFYMSLLALCLSVFWLKSSRVLWHSAESSWYLNERCALYQINSVTETDDTIELSGMDSHERDRFILIQKKKTG